MTSRRRKCTSLRSCGTGPLPLCRPRRGCDGGDDRGRDLGSEAALRREAGAAHGRLRRHRSCAHVVRDAGTGEPLVLLHGGLDTNASWGAQLDALAAHFRVVAPERRARAHARRRGTAVVPGDDGRPRAVHRQGGRGAGARGGGGATARSWGSCSPSPARPGAQARADRRERRRGGVRPAVRGDRAAAGRQPGVPPFRAVYEAVSPDGPEHWPVVFEKVTSMLAGRAADPARRPGRGAGAHAGDGRGRRRDHPRAHGRGLPRHPGRRGSRVIPGASHVAAMEKPDLVNTILLDFLRRDASPTVMPVRRAATAAHA